MARYILEITDGSFHVHEVEACYVSETKEQSNGNITIFHGSLSEELAPGYGMGKPYHDYGNGFYTTEDKELASEWAVSLSTGENGYCHAYSLDITKLSILNIDTAEDILSWMAILMRHRPGTDSRRWDLIQQRFIEKYYIDVDSYDAIIGYRANDSYLAIAKQFARGEVGVSILGRLLKLGSLGVQVCIKSRLAVTWLRYLEISEVDYKQFHTLFIRRDEESRRRMRELINSHDNDLDKTIESTI